jgi:soluble lytic murein transglycosylase-like protein
MKILFILLILLTPAMSKEAVFKYSWQTKQIESIVEKEARKKNIPSRLLYNLYDVESSGNPKAKGKVIRIKVNKKYIFTQAHGMGQIIPELHYAGKPKEDLLRPEINIPLSASILANCIKKSKGSLIKGLQRYNGQVVNINMAYVNKILKGVKIDLTKYI